MKKTEEYYESANINMEMADEFGTPVRLPVGRQHYQQPMTAASLDDAAKKESL